MILELCSETKITSQFCGKHDSHSVCELPFEKTVVRASGRSSLLDSFRGTGRTVGRIYWALLSSEVKHVIYMSTAIISPRTKWSLRSVMI